MNLAPAETAFTWKRSPLLPSQAEPNGLLRVNEVPMHVCAFEVIPDETVDPDDLQALPFKPVDPSFDDDLKAIEALLGDVPAPRELPGLTGFWIVYCIPASC